MELLSLIGSVSSSFYDDNQNCPLEWEPSGSDFLSQCLQEADLQGLLYSGDQDSFAAWCLDFLPQLFDGSYDLEPGKIISYGPITAEGRITYVYQVKSQIPQMESWCTWRD